MRVVDIESLYYFVKNRLGAPTWEFDLIPEMGDKYLIDVMAVHEVIGLLYKVAPEATMRVVDKWNASGLVYLIVQDHYKCLVFRQ